MSDFQTLLHRFNSIILESESELKDLQVIRAKHFGKNVSNYNFWGSNPKFSEEYYAYHHGGQQELQFNISEEEENENGEPIFRYGIAFSIQATRTNPNPEETLKPLFERFNLFLHQYPNYFKGYKMWKYDLEGRSRFFNVRELNDAFKSGSKFIFIGKYLKKKTTEITDDDIEIMIDEFEYLLPVYKFVQLEDGLAITENKIAKICWNENRWTKPSGRIGKSKFKKSHEYKHGYGHEEWLLDFSKAKGGYHYGFLEPIHKFRDKYIGNTFNVALYTTNADTKEKFWIGEIKNAHVIGYDEAEKMVEIYKNNNWINEMVTDLEDVGLDGNSLQEWVDKTLFNVKFKEEDYKPLPQPVLIENDDDAIRSSRYILLNRKIEPKAIKEITGKFVVGNKSGKRNLAKSVKKTFTEKSIEIPQIHNLISEGLERELNKIYDKVVPENDTGYGTSIDIVVEHKGEIFFYEIKTYSHIMTCIRQALGQLIEYAYYPNKSLAKKIFIVSQHKTDKESKEYIEHIRNKFSMPLHYLCFDYQNEKIVEEF